MERLLVPALAFATAAGLSACEASPQAPPSPIAVDVKAEAQRQYEQLPYLQVNTLEAAHQRVELTLDANKLTDLSEPARQKVASAILHLTAKSHDSPLYGSGFFFRDSAGNTKIVTAGHNLQGIAQGSMSWADATGKTVPTNEGSWHYNVSPREDLGIVNSADGMHPALSARDIASHPLKLGEQVFMVNYQQRTNVAENNGPASYSMLYLGNRSQDWEERRPFAAVLGDIQQSREEDSLQPGASGGVVVDKNGDVLGMSVSSAAGGFVPELCDKPILLPEDLKLLGKTVRAQLTVPSTVDECASGLSKGSIRLIEDGDFLPHPAAQQGTVQ